MMEQVRQNTGELPWEMSADAGYFSKDAVKKLAALGREVFIPPELSTQLPCPPAPWGRIPQEMSLTDRMKSNEGVVAYLRCA